MPTHILPFRVNNYPLPSAPNPNIMGNPPYKFEFAEVLFLDNDQMFRFFNPWGYNYNLFIPDQSEVYWDPNDMTKYSERRAKRTSDYPVIPNGWASIFWQQQNTTASSLRNHVMNELNDYGHDNDFPGIYLSGVSTTSGVIKFDGYLKMSERLIRAINTNAVGLMIRIRMTLGLTGSSNHCYLIRLSKYVQLNSLVNQTILS